MNDDSRQLLQFGLWPSPITPVSIAASTRISDLAWDDETGALVWCEERSGQGVLVCVDDASRSSASRDLTDSLSVRARVGYGGGDFGVGRGSVFFVERASGRIYRQALSEGTARPITPAFGVAASPTLSPDGEFLAYVHSSEHVDRIAVVDANGKSWPRIFAEGHDFFMQPTWSPDGRRFAWVAWDHPNMPWDECSVFVGDVERDAHDNPTLANIRSIAGGSSVSTFQPAFLPDGVHIAYISDESGAGALVVHSLATDDRRSFAIEGADLLAPGWGQGMRTFSLTPDGAHAIVAAPMAGEVRAFRVDLATGDVVTLAALSELSHVDQPAVRASDGAIALLASSPTVPLRLVTTDPGGNTLQIIRRTSTENLSPSALSKPAKRSWASSGGSTSHGLFYPPASEHFSSEGAPPLVVLVHGGPTASVFASWAPSIQFLTTRGYAVLAVNHRGSTSYGRAYRQSLVGNWGVFDVEDSVSGMRALADAGEIDPNRTAIMGGSAGGFTVLQTMIDHPDAFTAGVCLYGVANQFLLAAETHKFEAHYTDSLIGPLPEAASLYRERSPQFHADKIRRPLAIFQGEDDQVVLKNQSDVIVAALARNGVQHEYHVYAGEGHGWRKRETIEAYYAALDRFLRNTLVYS